MILLIDDVRNLPGMDIIARTAEAGRVMLSMGGWDELYLDNDLGDTVEGWQILKEAAIKYPTNIPNFVQLVTSNTVARDKMSGTLLDLGFRRSANGINFIKE